MGFSVERTKETVKIYGVEYAMKQPTVNDAIVMSKKAKEAEKDPEKSITVMEELRDWVISLNLPADVINGMEQKHFLALVEYINMDPKKKAELIAGS